MIFGERSDGLHGDSQQLGPLCDFVEIWVGGRKLCAGRHAASRVRKLGDLLAPYPPLNIFAELVIILRN